MVGRMSWRRLIYSTALYGVAPLVPLYLLWRARKQPEYARGWAERFAVSYGAHRRSNAARRVWLHAVSLGETRAAKPLVDAFFKLQPDAHIILTHTTPTGRAAGQELFADDLHSGRMTQVYVPYDLPDVIARFLRHFAPTDFWLMETEIWPNMIAACVQRNIPVSLLNGRLSEKTLQKTLNHGFVAQLFGWAYAQFANVCAQSDADAARYAQVGVRQSCLVVTGNVKFDMTLPPEQIEQGEQLKAWAQRANPSHSMVLLASTREGEEQMWLDARANFDDSNIQWWLVPRHPQRFNEVERLLSQAGFVGDAVLRKTELDAMGDAVRRNERLQKARVVLGDTMGEMFAYYAAADVVLMGGAWQPQGGQNFLEPLALGKPTLIGPHTYNFAQVASDAVVAAALIQVDRMDSALVEVQRVLTQPVEYERYQANARYFVIQHQGAVQRTLAIVL